jgi:hypothetical protein
MDDGSGGNVVPGRLDHRRSEGRMLVTFAVRGQYDPFKFASHVPR